jgi:hypothetical protein
MGFFSAAGFGKIEKNPADLGKFGTSGGSRLFHRVQAGSKRTVCFNIFSPENSCLMMFSFSELQLPGAVDSSDSEVRRWFLIFLSNSRTEFVTSANPSCSPSPFSADLFGDYALIFTIRLVLLRNWAQLILGFARQIGVFLPTPFQVVVVSNHY